MAANHSSNSLEQYKAAVILRDGSALHLRPVHREDEERLLALFHRLSHHTICLRFHRILREMSREEVQRFCTVDYDDSFALVATMAEDRGERLSEDKEVAVNNLQQR